MGIAHDRHHAVTEAVIGAFYEVYNCLRAGHLESVYERAMVVELQLRGVEVRQQQPVTVHYKGMKAGFFKADLLVGQAVAVEIKACRAIEPAHEAQLMNYLKSSDVEAGLLLNFGPKAEVRRRNFANEIKRGSAPPP